MITTIVLDRENKSFTNLTDPAQISDLREDTENVVWVDVLNPDAQDYACLIEEFGFHPLAIEDCQQPHQRPKVDEYLGYYFIVLYEAEFTPTNELILRELNIFLGTNYVVTVHNEPVKALAQGEKLWRSWTDLAKRGSGLLAYLLIDAVVDEYFPILDTISEWMDDIEDELFDETRDAKLEDIFAVKKDLLLLRRSIAPLRDVFNTLLRREQQVFSRETQVYFQDVYDHILRVGEMIDNLRDLLGSTMDVYLSLQSNRMNIVMKRLTAISTILMSAALVSGIYGMNFAHMPELQWEYGYYLALGFMALLVVGLLIFFRHIKWL